MPDQTNPQHPRRPSPGVSTGHLGGAPLKLPPLRSAEDQLRLAIDDRKEAFVGEPIFGARAQEIADTIAHFIENYARRFHQNLQAFSEDTIQKNCFCAFESADQKQTQLFLRFTNSNSQAIIPNLLIDNPETPPIYTGSPDLLCGVLITCMPLDDTIAAVQFKIVMHPSNLDRHWGGSQALPPNSFILNLYRGAFIDLQAQRADRPAPAKFPIFALQRTENNSVIKILSDALDEDRIFLQFRRESRWITSIEHAIPFTSEHIYAQTIESQEMSGGSRTAKAIEFMPGLEIPGVTEAPALRQLLSDRIRERIEERASKIHGKIQISSDIIFEILSVKFHRESGSLFAFCQAPLSSQDVESGADDVEYLLPYSHVPLLKTKMPNGAVVQFSCMEDGKLLDPALQLDRLRQYNSAPENNLSMNLDFAALMLPIEDLPSQINRLQLDPSELQRPEGKKTSSEKSVLWSVLADHLGGTVENPVAVMKIEIGSSSSTYIAGDSQRLLENFPVFVRFIGGAAVFMIGYESQAGLLRVRTSPYGIRELCRIRLEK